MCVLQELIEKAEQQPNLTIGVLVAIVVVFFSLFLKLIFGGKKVKTKFHKEFYAQWSFVDSEKNLINMVLQAAAPVEKKKPEVAESSKSGDEAEKKEETAAPRKRQPRRDNQNKILKQFSKM